MGKRNRKKMIAYALVGVMSMVNLFGTRAETAAAGKAPVRLNKSSATVKKGKKITLKVVKNKASKIRGVKWSVKNKKVATVSKKGVVKGVKTGKTTVTCKLQYQAQGKKKFQKKNLKCRITVRAGGEDEDGGDEEASTSQPAVTASVSARPTATTAVPAVTSVVPPAGSAAPTGTAAPGDTGKPTETAGPEDTTRPTETAGPEDTIRPTETAGPENTTNPMETAFPEVSGGPTGVPMVTSAPLPGKVALKVDPNWRPGQMSALAVDKSNFATYTADELEGKKITLTFAMLDGAEQTILGIYAGADENQGGFEIKGKESTSQTEYTFEITEEIAAALTEGGFYVALSAAELTSATLVNEGGEIIEPTEMPEATETVNPTGTPEATETAGPIETSGVAETAEPTATAGATPKETPEATPTETPGPTETAKPTATANPTEDPSEKPETTPKETVQPTATAEPTPKETPEATPTEMPGPTATAETTEGPSEKPEATPTETLAPTPTAKPVETPLPCYYWQGTLKDSATQYAFDLETTKSNMIKVTEGSGLWSPLFTVDVAGYQKPTLKVYGSVYASCSLVPLLEDGTVDDKAKRTIWNYDNLATDTKDLTALVEELGSTKFAIEYKKPATAVYVYDAAVIKYPEDLVPSESPSPEGGSPALQFASKLGAGYNIGNSLDSNSRPNNLYVGGSAGLDLETSWGNPTKISREFIHAVKAAGFKTIRLPVTYINHVKKETVNGTVTYTIDADWLGRVKEIVDWALEEDLYIIINIHHDGADDSNGDTLNEFGGEQATWLSPLNCNGDAYTQMEAKFVSLWEQIATKFRDYPEQLLFADMNEYHHGYGAPEQAWCEAQNKLHQAFVDTVRATGGNNSGRYLIVPGYNTNIGYTVSNLVVPTDLAENQSEYRGNTVGHLIVEVHYYDPYTYAADNPSDSVWGDGSGNDSASWGNESHLEDEMRKMKTAFVDKGIPVIIGEFGAPVHTANGIDTKTDLAYRTYYYSCVVKAAAQYGIVPITWDNGTSYQLISRDGNITQPEIVNAIIKYTETPSESIEKPVVSQ